MIDFGIYTSGFDIAAMREAIRLSQKFFAAPVWNRYIVEQVVPPENATSDDDLDAYLRNSTFPAFHAVGTAATSARGAIYGVVNPDLLVKNATGLRIVDASVMVRDFC